MITNKFYNLAKYRLFKINRSLTGKGIKETLRIIKNRFPKFKIINVKSGIKIFDWKIPYEWNVNQAFIEDKNKKKIIDFKNNNLHLVGYSMPVNRMVSKKDLLKKIYTKKNIKNAIPYITSYYKRDWGFCESEIKLRNFKKKYRNSDKFKVFIDASFNPKGSLSYGEIVLGNKNSNHEILISTYICHPSMANDNLSGPITATYLINYILSKKYRHYLKLRKGDLCYL